MPLQCVRMLSRLKVFMCFILRQTTDQADSAVCSQGAYHTASAWFPCRLVSPERLCPPAMNMQPDSNCQGILQRGRPMRPAPYDQPRRAWSHRFRARDSAVGDIRLLGSSPPARPLHHSVNSILASEYPLQVDYSPRITAGKADTLTDGKHLLFVIIPVDGFQC